MKTLMLLSLVFLVSCTTAPVKTAGYIVQDRDSILSQAQSQFQQCIQAEKGDDVSLELHFKLYDARAPLLVKPQKLAYNPKTNIDDIDVRIKSNSGHAQVEIDCVKRELRKLAFNPVNPSYNYMVYHRYVMTFKTQEPIVVGHL